MQTSWFDGDEEKKFEDLLEGLYEATLTNATLDETKEEPRLTLEFTLTTKRKVWMNLKFSEKQKKFANWQFRELGVYDRAKEIVAGGESNIAHAFLIALGEIIGSICGIEITYRDWQGKRYQSVRVESCSPANSAKTTTTTPTPTPTIAKTTTAPAPAFKADEELPF